MLVKEICERCGNTFNAGPKAHFCMTCRKEMLSEQARRRNLSRLGNAARWNRKEQEKSR